MSLDTYFPPPESRGGWRWLQAAEDVQALAGMDAVKLDLWAGLQLAVHSGFAWSMVIIRHGYLVREIATFNVLSTTTFDIWSGTKSFTATAWGLLLSGEVPVVTECAITLETPIYSLIPEGYPLTDPRKASITVGQMLSMTSGIKGESAGLYGAPTRIDAGPYEFALGRAPNRSGLWADKLAADPGERWDYSDAAYCHLSPAFAHATGREIGAVLEDQVLTPTGIEHATWDVQGGSGWLGPHTNAHTGLHMSARELARFGYLALHAGRWKGQVILPAAWQAKATARSQDLNPAYGYGWWTNASDTYAPGLPADLFALAGFAGNRCYVVPSLDLVVARVGTGPFVLDERSILGPIVEAIL